MTREILAKLSARDVRNLGPKNTVQLHRTLRDLLRESDQAGLTFVPVFGYLSLITTNHVELGKPSQRKVVNGVDVLRAQLPGYSVQPIASTVFRGSPERPGLVAGLAPSTSGSAPGVVLAVPRARVVELLPKILLRELATENDLKSTDGSSPLMYLPTILPVKLASGRTVKALVFTSDPNSPKNLATQAIFKDTDNVTGAPSPGALAWMMTSRGGVQLGGQVRGGATADYWAAYREAMHARGLAIEPWITNALEAAGAERFSGAATPIEYREQQRTNGPQRVP